MNKRIASVGIVAGLALGGGAGLVLSQVGGATAGTLRQVAPVDDTTPVTTAGSTGTASSTPAANTDRPAPGVAEKTALDKLVSDGTITQTQEDAVIKALDAARPAGGRGPGMGGRHGGGGGMQFDVAAKAIGVSADDLKTAVKGGQTVAAVATSKGITPQAVIDALVAEAKTHEAAAVTSGRQTQAEADTKLADATNRITTWVNSTPATAADRPQGGPRDGGRPEAAPADPAPPAPATTTA